MRIVMLWLCAVGLLGCLAIAACKGAEATAPPDLEQLADKVLGWKNAQWKALDDCEAAYYSIELDMLDDSGIDLIIEAIQALWWHSGADGVLGTEDDPSTALSLLEDADLYAADYAQHLADGDRDEAWQDLLHCYNCLELADPKIAWGVATLATFTFPEDAPAYAGNPIDAADRERLR